MQANSSHEKLTRIDDYRWIIVNKNHAKCVEFTYLHPDYYCPELRVTVSIKMSKMSAKEMYYLKVAWKASRDVPEENIVYAVLVEFFLRHKNPPYRFILYPQMSLKWKPNNLQDSRQEITDLGLVIFTREGYKLRCGVEAKRASSVMAELPDANYIMHNIQVQAAFRVARYQATDQAKAAFKNNYCFDRQKPIHWILVVGPYWTPILLGPFSEAELTVRSHKPSSSEDFKARVELDVLMTQPPPVLEELYCFNSQSSYDRIEAILEETDNAAQPFIEQMLSITNVR